MKQMTHHMDLKSPEKQQSQQSLLHQPDMQGQLRHLPPPFSFLADVLSVPTTTTTSTAADQQDVIPRYLGSDVVELDHCDLQRISDWTPFMTWSAPVVNDTIQSLSSNALVRKTLDPQDFVLMEQEFILELLEMYATRNGFCEFDKYLPSVPKTTLHDQAGAVLQQSWTGDTTSTLPRFLIVIIAFKDIQQLERLIQAIIMPQHRFIIHLERHTPSDYVQHVKELCQKYDKAVIMIQFGTVIYQTDSVSMINLRIMRWAVDDLKLSYDYHVQVDGAVYPLWNAHELAVYVQQQAQPTSVWLGELTHRGQVVRDVDHTSFLQRKRLVWTATTSVRAAKLKLQKKLSGKQISHAPQPSSNTSTTAMTEWLDVAVPPSFIQKTMRYKTNSGNQAIYSYTTVKKLLQSPHVMELFALAKYGCCCCIEERSWIAALALIGNEALEDGLYHTSMFQVWGGLTEQTCGSSMNNAVLSSNSSLCYRLEDAHLQHHGESMMTTNNETQKGRRKKFEPVNLWGNETMDYLKRAKARGVWFARKFKSTDEQSMALLKEIQDQLHQSKPVQ